jgi:NAD(P)-dependent dehydrogenase (short-subunit alcohol dehydrogenase family)
MKDVIVIVGAGFIGQAIARRVGSGKKVLLSGFNEDDLKKSQEIFLNAGFDVIIQTVDISSKESVQSLVKTATSLGNVVGVINAAGVSPSQASIEMILKVDLYGTALVLEEFGKVINKRGSAIVISSQSGHRMPALTQEEDYLLATTPPEKLLDLEIINIINIKDTLHAYQLAKRANGLRVMYEAVRWGKKGARVNTISPGIIITPLANDEINGPRGDFYKNMIESCPVKRAGTPDEIGNLAAYLMSDDGSFITGSDFLIDGGSTSFFKFGK